MARNSQQSQDSIILQTVGLPLGTAGLDLRQPADPRALSKLINARFRDERLIERRNGYLGQRVQDASAFPQELDEDDVGISVPMEATGWIYGHGQLIPQNPSTLQTDLLPIARQARGGFEYDCSKIVWTGDRLLVMRNDG